MNVLLKVCVVSDKFSQIIAAGRAAFEDKGYRVSMVDIAKRAGVAKQTLYNHFESKEALFAEVFTGCGAEAASVLDNTTLSVADKIMAFAFALRRVSMSPNGVAGYRAMTAEAHQFPELAASFYQQGVGILHRQTAAMLAEAHRLGQLVCPNPNLAADMLFSMLTGFERSRLLLGVAQGDDGTDARVAPIVAAFLRAFAAPAA